MFKKCAMWFGWAAGWFTVGFFGTKFFLKACEWFADKITEDD